MHREPAFPPDPHDEEDYAREAFLKIGFIERCQRKIFASVFSSFDLHPSQGFALHMVVNHPGQSQRELADAMRIERATVTVMLQKLEKGGFIRRESDPADLRIIRIYPTEKGIRAETGIGEGMSRFHASCFSSLSHEEYRQLLALLTHLESVVVQYQSSLNCQKESSKNETNP